MRKIKSLTMLSAIVLSAAFVIGAPSQAQAALITIDPETGETTVIDDHPPITSHHAYIVDENGNPGEIEWMGDSETPDLPEGARVITEEEYNRLLLPKEESDDDTKEKSDQPSSDPTKEDGDNKSEKEQRNSDQPSSDPTEGNKNQAGAETFAEGKTTEKKSSEHGSHKNGTVQKQDKSDEASDERAETRKKIAPVVTAVPDKNYKEEISSLGIAHIKITVKNPYYSYKQAYMQVILPENMSLISVSDTTDKKAATNVLNYRTDKNKHWWTVKLQGKETRTFDFIVDVDKGENIQSDNNDIVVSSAIDGMTGKAKPVSISE